MQNKALIVIDIQNDITKNYKDIIDNLNNAIDWAKSNGLYIVYIKHNNLTADTRTFKPDTLGAEIVPELKIESENIFTKNKGNALTSEAFSAFIKANDINEFFVVGADATACVKSTVFNLAKENYTVNVISDCITSYDKRKIDEMLAYYEAKGAKLLTTKTLLA